MPIFVYRCDCGHRFERLVRRDTVDAPACPECGGETRKIPAGPSLRRGATRGSTGPEGATGGSVPIPWRGVVSGGPEKMKREVEFRRRLEAEAVGGLRIPGGPDVHPTQDTGGTSGGAPSASPASD